MRVLVTGGAGYVGSVVVEELAAAGAERIVVLDVLSRGHASSVVVPATLVVGRISDAERVVAVCREEKIDAVVHMAASSLVGESVKEPSAYYRNNVVAGIALLDAMREAGVRLIVFSSSAAVYGEPSAVPITEDAPSAPTNPYGETKLAFERVMAWYGRAYGLVYASLRYFNAAGATERNGEDHDPETHLIPIVLDAASGRRERAPVFGDDYPTPDGTCIRDYIHVSDLARAHVLALEGMDERGSRVYNLGCGGGYSVRQVIDAAREVTGREIPVDVVARRPGDPAVLVASSERIRRELGWEPRRQDVRQIVADAWRWRREHPAGYSSVR
jgi:UDP-glucose 4-epimerase